MRRLMLAVGCLVLLVTLAPAPTRGGSGDRDERAVDLAESVLRSMGGREAWEATRHVRWNFFGRRLHYWDRRTGDIRIDSPAQVEDGEVKSPALLILMNIDSKRGRAWEDGVEVGDPQKLAGLLDEGHKIWVNDSYWMFMPYKLLDPGVTLRHAGERKLEDGRIADVLELTFGEGVGYTPENRYEVFVARDSGLVEQWSFFSEASETEPRFTMPWAAWRSFGRIKLATDHGRQRDWKIAVYDELPRAIYESPAAPPD